MPGSPPTDTPNGWSQGKIPPPPPSSSSSSSSSSTSSTSSGPDLPDEAVKTDDYGHNHSNSDSGLSSLSGSGRADMASPVLSVSSSIISNGSTSSSSSSSSSSPASSLAGTAVSPALPRLPEPAAGATRPPANTSTTSCCIAAPSGDQPTSLEPDVQLRQQQQQQQQQQQALASPYHFTSSDTIRLVFEQAAGGLVLGDPEPAAAAADRQRRADCCFAGQPGSSSSNNDGGGYYLGLRKGSGCRHDELLELQKKKQELVRRIQAKLGVLHAELGQLSTENEANQKLGEELYTRWGKLFFFYTHRTLFESCLNVIGTKIFIRSALLDKKLNLTSQD